MLYRFHCAIWDIFTFLALLDWESPSAAAFFEAILWGRVALGKGWYTEMAVDIVLEADQKHAVSRGVPAWRDSRHALLAVA